MMCTHVHSYMCGFWVRIQKWMIYKSLKQSNNYRMANNCRIEHPDDLQSFALYSDKNWIKSSTNG